MEAARRVLLPPPPAGASASAPWPQQRRALATAVRALRQPEAAASAHDLLWVRPRPRVRRGAAGGRAPGPHSRPSLSPWPLNTMHHAGVCSRRPTRRCRRRGPASAGPPLRRFLPPPAPPRGPVPARSHRHGTRRMGQAPRPRWPPPPPPPRARQRYSSCSRSPSARRASICRGCWKVHVVGRCGAPMRVRPLAQSQTLTLRAPRGRSPPPCGNALEKPSAPSLSRARPALAQRRWSRLILLCASRQHVPTRPTPSRTPS